MKKPLDFGREVVAKALRQGGYAVDATCGNGRDTIFLAELVGGKGKVLALDIQEEAVQRTANRLLEAELSERVKLVCAGHERLAALIDEPIDAAMFNLGYLPGGSRKIITRPENTVPAVAACLDKLKTGGAVTLMIYTGHEGGREEYEALLSYARNLPQEQFAVLEYKFINQKNDPPLLIAIRKL